MASGTDGRPGRAAGYRQGSVATGYARASIPVTPGATETPQDPSPPGPTQPALPTDTAPSTTDTTADPTATVGTTSSAATTDEPTTSGPDPTAATSATTLTTGTTATTDDTTGAAIGCADLPLCEDFEDAADGTPPNPALWTVTAPNCMGAGKLAVASDQAHSSASPPPSRR